MPVLWLDFRAAEVMLRRRLVWRTAWFLVGAVLFMPVSEAFPPLELDKIVIFVGGLFFLVLGAWVFGWWSARESTRRSKPSRGFISVSCRCPWILTIAAIHQRQIRCRAAAAGDDLGGGEVRHAGLVRGPSVWW